MIFSSSFGLRRWLAHWLEIYQITHISRTTVGAHAESIFDLEIAQISQLIIGLGKKSVTIDIVGNRQVYTKI